LAILEYVFIKNKNWSDSITDDTDKTINADFLMKIGKVDFKKIVTIQHHHETHPQPLSEKRGE
jgi:hypothetical protein